MGDIHLPLSSLQGLPQAEWVVVALLCWVVVYFAYKAVWRRDYGIPVQRRIFRFRLQVDHDQMAYVPFWWSDLQVQRALKAHLRRTMKQAFERPRGRR
jgi:hypothetical protein